MSKIANAEAIERMRQAIDPDGYIKALEDMKQQLIQRVSAFLANRDLNDGSPHLNEMEKDASNEQLDNAIADIDWRVTQIDERIAGFEADRARVTQGNRAQRRAKRDDGG